MKLLLLLQILLMLVGCNSEYASLSAINKTRIKVTAALPSGITADKIMLWGHNVNGNQFARIIEAGDEETFIFDNGQISLYAIAWTAADMSGDVYCATQPSALNGPDQNLQLNLTNANCDMPYFKGAVTTTSPVFLGSVKLELCEALTNIADPSHKCSDDLDSVFRKEARGHTMSYRYVLKTFDKTKNKYTFRSDEVSSACYVGTPDNATPLDGLSNLLASQIPTGDGSSTPFYLTLETFPGSTICDSATHGKLSLTLQNGLIKDSSKSKYFVEASGTSHKLYVQQSGTEVCNSTTNAQTFAGGDGTRLSPYLVCNATQFYNMHTSRSSSFKLMNDINLTPYYYGITTLPNIPNGLTCLEKGSNFFPLGYDSSTCTESAETFAANDFDGGGKTIKGLKIDMPGNENIGLFTRKYGGEIRRVKLENTSVKGLYYIGSLAGHNKATIRDVVLDKVQIEGTSIVGGVAGTNSVHPNNCVFKNILLEKASVTSATTNAGGIIGLSESCEFSDITVSGNIVGSTNDIGGISGSLSNSSIDRVSVEGLVKGKSYVGGISGSLFNTGISNSKVVGGVFVTQISAGVNAGGLIGFTNGIPNASTYLNNSYFFGQVTHFCQAATSSDCGIGNIVGDPGGWGAGDLSSNYYTLTNSIGPSYSPLNTGTSRTESNFYNPATVWPAAFTKNGDLPRLPHEVTSMTTDLRHPCQKNYLAHDTVAMQIAAGKGNSADNPIGICNYLQLADMQVSPLNASKYYKLLSPILGTSTFPIATNDFTGQLDGDNKQLIRFKFSGAAGFDTAWWRSLSSTAVIKNLFLIDSRINAPAAAATTSLIAKTNNGTIDRVYALNTLSMPTNAGEHSLFVHTNTGTIKNSYIGGSSNVTNRMAAAAYNNSGTIEDSQIHSLLNCTAGVNCYNVSGLAINNSGTIRRNFVESNIEDSTGTIAESNFAFISVFNDGLIEDIQIKSTSSITSLKYAAHAITRLNSMTGTIRRVFNEGSVALFNPTPPYFAPYGSYGSIDFEESVSGGVGYSDNGGNVSNIAYTKIGRHSYSSQVNYVSRTPGTGTCQYTLNGGLPAAWEAAMVNPSYFNRFGLMVLRSEETYFFSAAPTLLPALNDTFTVQDSSPCSMTIGNPVIYYYPYDYRNGTDLITNVQKLSWATFSGWSGAFDITADDSVVHQSKYKEANGISSTKPVWIFDTSNSMRLNNR